MLEKMGDFFDARLDGYEDHQLSTIESAREFYPFTAKCLPTAEGTYVLDLGCGTGLELDEFFALNKTAKVTGIDLAAGMLDALQKKFSGKDITLINGSYFEVPFGEEKFDAAVSVESLHHFTKEEKIPLYTKLRAALKSGGYFILTDYFANSEDEETRFRQELLQIRKEQKLSDDEFYHYDTPLTVEHEKEALIVAGKCLESSILRTFLSLRKSFTARWRRWFYLTNFRLIGPIRLFSRSLSMKQGGEVF
ncbi:MAG: class I SAM-dependent methyltransferase [Butyrivibrio sp.]|nr:class I SAM-dependent methyltransferase [Butyrivibrio sp.]